MQPHERQLTFDWMDPGPPAIDPAGAPRPMPGVAELAGRLSRLTGQGVFLGTSSWKYPGWCGRLYDPRRYQVRGRFSPRKFNDECLREYAAVFPTVCGDFAFYQFPSPESWRRLFDAVPADFRFSLKVPEQITVERFPDQPRYGKRAGSANGHFLDADLLNEQLLRPLAPYRDRLGVLVLQFGTFHAGPMCDAADFADALRRFFSKLPVGDFRFAVEVRNAAFLHEPGRSAYLASLREHGVAHCFNSWTRMPAVDEQLRVPGMVTAPFVAARFLLRPGRSYAQAVERFSPYERVQDPYPAGRDALRTLLDTCVSAGSSLYAFINNRFEGNAIDTIDEVTQDADRP